MKYIMMENIGVQKVLGFDIFTQGKTLDELMDNIKEAVEVHFEEDIQFGKHITILSMSEIEVAPIG
ncbi:type II toxin-antitoxin system HicB family antitoxin [Methanothermococcus okinawensis]|uniref:type II toxin-antitoxin system HicB family antitoxin n=1 Tax=Methanothermococcus okinawensis TaxID=155863 RepID=UPI001E4DEC65|nr:type II toxin-antitoxin system HicB family antitoxin [Methanothermococcus okinawensis]